MSKFIETRQEETMMEYRDYTTNHQEALPTDQKTTK
jgi:hypothetical protein